MSKPVARLVNHRILSAALLPLALVLCHPRAANAQTRGVFAVGVTVTYTQPGADELDSSVTVGPTFRTLPRKGWGPAFAFNWYGADLTDRSVGTNDKLGRFIARPLLFGVGYTVVRGRTSISPSLVAGPSFKPDLDRRGTALAVLGGGVVVRTSNRQGQSCRTPRHQRDLHAPLAPGLHGRCEQHHQSLNVHTQHAERPGRDELAQ